jgi:hypothetical protein
VRTTWIRIWMLVFFVLLNLAFVITVAAGNDFVYGELRVNLGEIYNAKDYQVWLNATALPSGGYPDYTTAWLGVELAQYNGQPYSAQFSQVGLLTKSDGIRWFVYAEPGVTCLRGAQAWGNRGCQGSVGDLVSLGNWHKVELVTYQQGFWIARVYTSNNVGYDVAQIWSTSSRIYRAGSVTEEAYGVAQDPYLTASFYHWHPQYMIPGSGFKDWHESDSGGTSKIYVTDLNSQNTFCPQHYGIRPNFYNDERAWYAGSGGEQCWWLLFPSAHIYLPLVIQDAP